MFVKKVLYKLYLKLIFFSLVFFLSTTNLVISAVLTEEEIKYIESQSKNLEKDDKYIQYEDIKEKKSKPNPFNFFGITKKKKKKIEKKTVLENKTAPDKLKIGVLLPLTGKHSYIGQSLLDTMQIIIYENS